MKFIAVILLTIASVVSASSSKHLRGLIYDNEPTYTLYVANVCPTKNVKIELGGLDFTFEPKTCHKLSNDSWLNHIHYYEITDTADVIRNLYCVADPNGIETDVPEGRALETIQQCTNLRNNNTNAAPPMPQNVCVLTTTQC